MVDMLTLVLVGASSTRQVDGGRTHWTYTPRGMRGSGVIESIPLPLAGERR